MKLIAIALFFYTGFNFFHHEKPVTDCSHFRRGTFYYRGVTEDTTLYKVERNDSVQTETKVSDGSSVTLRLQWLNDCTYRLSFLRQHIVSGDTIPADFQKVIIRTSIKSIKGDSCHLETIFENVKSNDVLRGVLYIAK